MVRNFRASCREARLSCRYRYIVVHSQAALGLVDMPFKILDKIGPSFKRNMNDWVVL